MSTNPFFRNTSPENRMMNSVKKIEQGLYQEEHKSEKAFAKVGQYIVPAIVVCLTTYGVGELISGAFPEFLAYMICAIFAMIIESGQFVFGRPVMKRLAKKQEVTSGQILVVVIFTMLSVGLSSVGVYSGFLKVAKTEQSENKNVFQAKLDSVSKEHNNRKMLFENQIKNLDATRLKRYAGVLSAEEQVFQKQLNSDLKLEDSTYSVKVAQLKVAYNIDQPKKQDHFSAIEFFKWAGAIFLCIVFCALTLYCHYSEFRFYWNSTREMAIVLTGSDKNVNVIHEATALKKAHKVYSDSLESIAESEGIVIKLTPIEENKIEDTQALDSDTIPDQTQTVQAPIQTQTQSVPSPIPNQVQSLVAQQNQNRMVIRGFSGRPQQQVQQVAVPIVPPPQIQYPDTVTASVTETVTENKPVSGAEPYPYTSKGIYFYQVFPVLENKKKQCSYCGEIFHATFDRSRFCTDPEKKCKEKYHAELNVFKLNHPNYIIEKS